MSSGEDRTSLEDMVKEGVERKKEESDARSRENAPNPHVGMTDASEELFDVDRTQDEFSTRSKNTGKGKKTADKWNQ